MTETNDPPVRITQEQLFEEIERQGLTEKALALQTEQLSRELKDRIKGMSQADLAQQVIDALTVAYNDAAEGDGEDTIHSMVRFLLPRGDDHDLLANQALKKDDGMVTFRILTSGHDWSGIEGEG